jgi:hypothetical protein
MEERVESGIEEWKPASVYDSRRRKFRENAKGCLTLCRCYRKHPFVDCHPH